MSFPTQWEPAKSIAAGPEILTLTSGAGDSEIAVRAYEIWQQRGCPIGTPDRDWFQAEAELRGDLLD